MEERHIGRNSEHVSDRNQGPQSNWAVDIRAVCTKSNSYLLQPNSQAYPIFALWLCWQKYTEAEEQQLQYEGFT